MGSNGQFYAQSFLPYESMLWIRKGVMGEIKGSFGLFLLNFIHFSLDKLWGPLDLNSCFTLGAQYSDTLNHWSTESQAHTCGCIRRMIIFYVGFIQTRKQNCMISFFHGKQIQMRKDVVKEERVRPNRKEGPVIFSGTGTHKSLQQKRPCSYAIKGTETKYLCH